MASNNSTATGKRIDPFSTYKFHVEIGDITEAYFSECSGLEMSTDVFEYKEGGLNEYSHKFPGRISYSNVTLKRGFATSNELFNWFQKMSDDLSQGNAITKKLVTIKLYSTADASTSTSWTLHDAFPTKWSGPSFNTGQAAAAIESIEFAHHGITLT